MSNGFKTFSTALRLSPAHDSHKRKKPFCSLIGEQLYQNKGKSPSNQMNSASVDFTLEISQS